MVSQDKAKRFELTPVWAPAEPPTKRAKTAEVRLSSASNVPMPPTNDENEKGSSDEEDSDSSGSNSDVSSQDDSSDVSDLEKFDEAYTDFGALTKGVDPRTLERDGSANPNEEVGRGMGSPIPSLKEGAWTREGPKFVDGGRIGRPLMSSFCFTSGGSVYFHVSG